MDAGLGGSPLHGGLLGELCHRCDGKPPRSSWVSCVFRWGLPLIAHLAIAAVSLWLLPGAFDLSLPRLLVFVPDYGSLAAFSGSFALIWGIVRSVVVGRWLRGNKQTPFSSVAEGDGAC